MLSSFYTQDDIIKQTCIFFLKLNVVFVVCYRASLGWFAYEPEWYDMNNMSFALSEAQSVSVFVQYLSNERVDQSESKARPRENGSSLIDVVRWLYLHCST